MAGELRSLSWIPPGTQRNVRIKLEYPNIVVYIVGQYFVCGKLKNLRISKDWSETFVGAVVEAGM